MTRILSAERDKYESAWAIDAYAKHSPGAAALPLFLDMASPVAGAKILDAGCGEGKGTDALIGAGFLVTACDFISTAYKGAAPFYEHVIWNIPRELRLLDGDFDYVYCCDVLEHIPTALTMLTVTRLLDAVKTGVFLTISNIPDNAGVWVGRPLHETVQPFGWWRDTMSEVAKVVEARDLLNYSAFYLEPRA